MALVVELSLLFLLLMDPRPGVTTVWAIQMRATSTTSDHPTTTHVLATLRVEVL